MKPPIYHRMFGYNLDLLPNSHLAELERGVTTIDEARKRTGATIGYPGWGLLYHILLSHLDREREEILIETGTNHGCTTIILAQALKDAGCAGRVVTLELEPENVVIARKNISAAGLGAFVEIIEGDVHETLPRVLGKNLYRFVFLDASHLEGDVLFEFESILPNLTDDALVVFDNTYAIAEEHEDGHVNGALKSIVERQGGNLINFEFVSWYTPGLAIWQKSPKL